MKKILFAAAACLALFSCEEAPIDKPDEKQDSIEITPETKTFDEFGGSVDVLVTSSDAWTLTAAEEYDWVSASVTEGADGELVKFTVVENYDVDKTADFTFVCGTAEASFKVFSYAGKLPAITVESETELEFDYKAQERVEILVSTDETNYRDLKAEVSEGADWLTYSATLPGETDLDAKIYFSVAALEGLEDREATITISAEGVKSQTVTVKQYAKHVLSTPAARYTAAIEGETITVPLTANVEYKVEIADGDGWLTVGEATAEGIPFTAAALADGKRAATVTFTQTDAAEGEEALVCTITITQVNALITWAADMTGNRLFPKWDGQKMAPAEAVTLECLVKFDSFDKGDGSIFTIMGIEGHFLLRMGDVGNPLTRLQVATMDGNYNVPFDFSANQWYHLAVVFENTTANVYVDGELKGTSQQFAERKYVYWPLYDYVYLKPLDLCPDWSYEPDGNRCFWVGYSYEGDRDTYGQMTEIRIWNKALTADEINAPNHFYTVDPNSEGLFSYWKFVEGKGSTIADATGKGNPLYGELDVRKQGNDNIGDEGIDWVEVALPDK